MSGLVIVCATDDGCTCGAPAATPTGMHHCDCAIHPGWCRSTSCLPCQENGKTRRDPTTTHDTNEADHE